VPQWGDTQFATQTNREKGVRRSLIGKGWCERGGGRLTDTTVMWSKCTEGKGQQEGLGSEKENQRKEPGRTARYDKNHRRKRMRSRSKVQESKEVLFGGVAGGRKHRGKRKKEDETSRSKRCRATFNKKLCEQQAHGKQGEIPGGWGDPSNWTIQAKEREKTQKGGATLPDGRPKTL